MPATVIAASRSCAFPAATLADDRLTPSESFAVARPVKQALAFD